MLVATPMNKFNSAGEAIIKLCNIMEQLRAPGGCPWDREQTLATLKPFLIEEAYETLEAMDSGDAKAHCEELGDLLLQVVFQAELTRESGSFDMADVANAISDKLIRRHPHVFGDASAANGAEALANWETIKASERQPQAKGTLDGVPRALPGLLRAFRTGEKAAAVGFDWQDAQGSMAKVREEWSELQQALETPEQRGPIEEEFGDLLFALVNLSRHLKIDPEAALRGTIDKFHRRFRYLEMRLADENKAISKTSLDRLNELWEEAKLFDPKR